MISVAPEHGLFLLGKSIFGQERMRASSKVCKRIARSVSDLPVPIVSASKPPRALHGLSVLSSWVIICTNLSQDVQHDKSILRPPINGTLTHLCQTATSVSKVRDFGSGRIPLLDQS